jgi:hypothetical protein
VKTFLVRFEIPISIFCCLLMRFNEYWVNSWIYWIFEGFLKIISSKLVRPIVHLKSRWNLYRRSQLISLLSQLNFIALISKWRRPLCDSKNSSYFDSQNLLMLSLWDSTDFSFCCFSPKRKEFQEMIVSRDQRINHSQKSANLQ